MFLRGSKNHHRELKALQGLPLPCSPAWTLPLSLQPHGLLQSLTLARLPPLTGPVHTQRFLCSLGILFPPSLVYPILTNALDLKVNVTALRSSLHLLDWVKPSQNSITSPSWHQPHLQCRILHDYLNCASLPRSSMRTRTTCVFVHHWTSKCPPQGRHSR